MDIVEITREIIANNKFLSLATCTKAGMVWVAPLAYAVDEEYYFYFLSAIDSTHIEYTKHNSNVAFAIYNSTIPINNVDGIQISGILGQVEAKDVPSVMEMYWKQLFFNISDREVWEKSTPGDFLSDEFPVLRFFQIQPIEIFKMDLNIIEVDRRIEIKLDDLKLKPAKFPTLK